MEPFMRPFKTIPEIQAVLDRQYPGIILAWNPVEQIWVLADIAVHANGSPALNLFCKPMQSLRGIFGDEEIHHVTIYRFELRNPMTGEVITTFKPALDRILQVLARIWTGGRQEVISERIDEVEASEDAEKQEQLKQKAEAGREAARVAWNRGRAGRVVSTREGYTDDRKVNREIERRLLDEHREAEAMEIDAAVKELAAEGKVFRAPGAI